MREATGELTITVVVVIAVGLLVAFFSTVLYPKIIKPSIQGTADCADAVCDIPGTSIRGTDGTDCSTTSSSSTSCCKYYKNKNNYSAIECPYKG